MSLIIAENVSHQYGAQEVLKRASFRVEENDRIGLVGPNGEGKTTLLRIVAGALDPTLGEVHRRRGLSVGYLPQEPPALHAITIRQAMLDAIGELTGMEDRMRELAALMAHEAGGPSPCPPPSEGEGQGEGDAVSSSDVPSAFGPQSSAAVRDALLREYGELQAAFEAKGGYTLNARIERILTGLGFDPSMRERPLAELSGGQRTRAYLATLLLKQPDLLLLDEPTNHLDLESVEWLEGWLQSFTGAIVVVSHDRYFLDRVTADTWEVAATHLERYRGSYSHYVRQRAERMKERMRTWKAQQEYIEKTQEFIRIHIAGQRTKEAQGRRTRLDRFMRDEAIERPRDFDAIHLKLPPATRTGQIVFRARDLVVGYDRSKPILEAPELEVQLADRVAVVGPNGSGKTTLLRTLLGDLEPLSGEVFRGAKVRVGYLSQTHAELDPQMTALEAVRAMDRETSAEQARNLLGALLLSGDDADKRIAQLSGGQRSRVILARLVVQKVNVLVLDEPTNHLDIPSTEILQDVLANFDGTVLFVSHDRYLIQQTASLIWAIEERQASASRLQASGTTEKTEGKAASSPPPPGEGRERADGKKVEGQRPRAKGEAHADASSSAASAVPSAFGLQPSAASSAVPEARSLKPGVCIPNVLRRTVGGWEGYLLWRRDHSGGAAVDREAEAQRETRREDHRDSRKRANELARLRRRHEQIEREIASLEDDLKSLNARISDASLDGRLDAVHKLGDEYTKKDARLKQLWTEWEQVGGELE